MQQCGTCNILCCNSETLLFKQIILLNLYGIFRPLLPDKMELSITSQRNISVNFCLRFFYLLGAAVKILLSNLFAACAILSFFLDLMLEIYVGNTQVLQITEKLILILNDFYEIFIVSLTTAQFQKQFGSCKTNLLPVFVDIFWSSKQNFIIDFLMHFHI